jgi:hypothetical protein
MELELATLDDIGVELDARVNARQLHVIYALAVPQGYGLLAGGDTDFFLQVALNLIAKIVLEHGPDEQILDMVQDVLNDPERFTTINES